ncbi:MAG: hypothetical protein GY714_10550 [Desulfobacterales bacterium]|nr:hypothetical protein [Desulfobacterales bacterium]
MINKVHWVFECGCNYEGEYYLFYGRRQCKIHKKPAAFEEIICPCGNRYWIFTNGRSPIFCDSCRDENNKYSRHEEKYAI